MPARMMLPGTSRIGRCVTFAGVLAAGCLLAASAPAAAQTTVNGYTFQNVFDFDAATGDRIHRLAVNNAGDTAAIVGPVVEPGRMVINGVTAFDLPSWSISGLGIDGTGRVLYSASVDGGPGLTTGIFDGPDIVANAVVTASVWAEEGFNRVQYVTVRNDGSFAFSGYFADDNPSNLAGRLPGVWTGPDWEADRRMTGLPDTGGSHGLTFEEVYLASDGGILTASRYPIMGPVRGVMLSEAPGSPQRELWVNVHPDWLPHVPVASFALSSQGDVAYQTVHDWDVLYLGDTTDHATPLIIAGDDQVWRSVGRPGFDDAGNLLFSGETSGPDAIRGLFTGPDPEHDRVLVVGDELFGSTVVEVGYWSYGSFAENGTLAIRYDLADGRRGVAITVIPEPAAAGAVLACLPLLLARRRRDAAS